METRKKGCSEADGMLTSNCKFVSFEIFMGNYFTYFCLLTPVLPPPPPHTPPPLGVNKIPAKCVFNKSILPKCTFIWEKQLQKKGKWPL